MSFRLLFHLFGFCFFVALYSLCGFARFTFANIYIYIYIYIYIFIYVVNICISICGEHRRGENIFAKC